MAETIPMFFGEAAEMGVEGASGFMASEMEKQRTE
jgi:hypothetical protein